MENFLTFTATADKLQYSLLKNKWTPLFHIYKDCWLTERQALAFLSYVLHGNKSLKHDHEPHTLGLTACDIDRLWQLRVWKENELLLPTPITLLLKITIP